MSSAGQDSKIAVILLKSLINPCRNCMKFGFVFVDNLLFDLINC